jgi:pristinamycin I synthase-3/4
LPPEDASYRLAVAARLVGPVSVPALRAAFQGLVDRHEALRTTYAVDEKTGEPVRRVASQVGVAFMERDASGWSAERLSREIEDAAWRPFDLEHGPLLRVAVLTGAAGGMVLVVAVHHIVADFASLVLLARQLGQEMAPAPAYSAFARRQAAELAGAHGDELWAWWREHLAGLPAAAGLPYDRAPEPGEQTSGPAGSVRIDLGPERTERLLGLARRQGATPYAALLAVYGALLARITGETDLAVGAPAAGRPAEASETVGYFANPLVLRLEVGGEPAFTELLAQARERLAGALAHQEMPLPLLVERLRQERPGEEIEPFRTMLMLYRAPAGQDGLVHLALGEEGGSLSLGPFELAPLALAPRSSQFDLTLSLGLRAGSLGGLLVYHAGRFEAVTMRRLAGHLETLLDGALERPEERLSDLPLLPEAARHQIVLEANDQAEEAPAWRSLEEGFERQARRTPERTALVFERERTTYEELNRRANRLAHHLVKMGVKVEDRVGVLLRRTPEMVTALLAVLKTGAAYVPLDPSLPEERLAFLRADSGAVAVVTRDLLDRDAAAIAGESGGDLPGRGDRRRTLAYVIYTSGSTGLPKGVGIEHGSALRLIGWAGQTYGAGELAGVLASTSIGFDLSVFELFAPLSFGGTVILAENALALPELPAAAEVTLLNTVPSAMAALLELIDRDALPRLATVNLAGEPLRRGLAERVLGPHPPTRPSPPDPLSRACPRTPTPNGRGGKPAELDLDASALSSGGGAPLPLGVGGGGTRGGGVGGGGGFGGVRLFNLYGPTEDTTYSAGWRVEPEDAEEPPVGRPVAGSRAYVADAALRLLPYGATGELCLGGAGLARGYLGRPALTAERFVPDPWSGEAGGRLYRTGDRVRQRADGALLYLGRLDRQLKIRGFRIEPGEIEAALLAHPGVRDAAVVRPAGQDALAAFVVLDGTAMSEGEAETELLAVLGRRLPAPLVPSAVIRLDALPLTPNGKVDRQALAVSSVGTIGGGEAAATPPRGEVEERLAAIWRELLGAGAAARIGRESRFFDLGGHSLLAARLVARVRQAFGVELPLSVAFEAPRLLDQARRIEAGRKEPAAPIPRAAQGDEEAQRLSFAQERLWFLDQLAPGGAVYAMPVALRLTGRLDIPALAGALAAVRRRHAVLRTTFAVADGTPYAVVRPAEGSFSLPVVDLRGVPGSAGVPPALRLASAEAARPFDLERGPLFRAALLRVGAEEHLLLLTLHHIVADGWSLEVLAREIGAFYGAAAARERAELPALPLQYADYAAWQRAALTAEALAPELAAWTERLAGLPPALALPGDRPRPPVQSFRGGTAVLSLPEPLRTALGTLGARSGATPFMVWLAGFAALLARLTGEADLAIGTAVANRTRVETEGLIGLFVNSLAVRGDLAGDPSFSALLGRLRESALWAYAHQELPFEKLVEALAPVRALSHAPLFQVMLVAEMASPAVPLPGLAVHRQPLSTGTAKVDLLLTLRDEGAELEFNRDLFDRTTALRLLSHLVALLAAAAASPECRLAELPLLAESERQQLLVEWSAAPLPPRGGATLPERFAAQAQRTPEAVALVHGRERITYADLAGRARGMAERLVRLGVGPEVRVGIFLQRTPDMVAALLGVLAAGGAYVPLDARQPAARLLWTLDDAGASLLVSEPELLGRLAGWTGRTVVVGEGQHGRHGQGHGQGHGREHGQGAVSEGNLAYVIYTSGSTGRPKGVGIEHRSAAAMLDWGAERFSSAELTGVLAATSIAFDLSVFEIFLPLTTGGRVILARDALELTSLAAAGEVTLVNTVPSAMAEILRLGGLPASVRTVNLAGEPLPALLAAEIYEQPQVRRVWNLYGPSEDTTYSTGSLVPRGGITPAIGRPLPGTRARVLDAALQPVPPGVPGELCLGGSGLARGYIGSPDLTASRFIPEFWGELGGEPGSRLYRTGDLVRFRPDGELDFLGRRDQQVKVRGFRVELGEIEAVLAEHPAVRAAAVLVVERPTGARLAACWAPRRPEADATDAALRAFLRERLPEPMVPASFLRLPVLPLTPNGKVDRKALLEEIRRGAEPTGGERPVAAPRTLVEESIAGIWREVLGSGPVDPTASFFEIGGHSLLATRVMSRLRGVFGVDLPVRTLFEAPSVRELARRVEAALDAARGGAAGRPLPPLTRRAGAGPPPLSFAQERLWFLDRLEAGAVYNIPLAIAVRGGLDRGLLAAALTAVARRHEALRTTFVGAGDGRAVQVIAPPESAAVPLPEADLSALPAAARTAEARRLAAEEAGRRFDLARGPLVRAALLRLDEREHVLLLDLHHIIADGWSMGVMVDEMAALYRGGAGAAAGLPALPVQYADFAVWQRCWLGETELARQMRFWRERLETAPVSLALPADRPRPAVQSFRGAAISFVLGTETTAGLLALGQRSGATPFMTLLAGFAALLLRITGQDDMVIGTPIANRNLLETERLIGFFVNSLPLRQDLAGDPATAELLARVRETALAAYAHQDLPFERLVEELRPERHLAQNPLFQVMFALQNAPLVPLAEMDLPGIALAPFPFPVPTAKLDLQLDLTEVEEAAGRVLSGELRYATDLFDAVTMERLIGHFRTLLAAVVTDPGARLADLPLLGDGERHQLTFEWNERRDAAAGMGPRSVLDLFAVQVARAPGAVAVVQEGDALTYGQLDRRANALAHRLRAAGVVPGAAVGLRAGRSPAAVAGLLGIWKAGAVYVPLDPEYPPARLSFLLEDAGLAAVVAELGEDESAAPPPALPGDLAYLIYTSGTTGRPKAVMVEHAALASTIEAVLGRFGFAPGERTAAIAPFTFDISLFELLAPLVSGGTVVLLPLTPALDVMGLVRSLPELDRLHAVPALMRQVVDLVRQSGDARLSIRLKEVFTGGDAVPGELLHDLPDVFPRARVWELYGPTEGTIFCTAFAVARPGGKRVRSLLGRPLPGAVVELCDPAGREVPIGVAGEIRLGGGGLARGYWRRADLTAERFVPAAGGGRLFRTGDLARRLADGRLEFLGRTDEQVKVRGFRIEPGEVESALLRHPEVREAVVAVQAGGPAGEAGGRLVAWVVCRREGALSGVGSPHAEDAAAEHVAAWRALYDETYSRSDGAAGGESFTGWMSSYTGLPIPVPEMREWLDATVERILSLGCRRVLEVGCGAGLLAARLVPHVERYRGIDFSAPALDRARRRLPERPGIELVQGLADDWSGIEPGAFDLVVINSVAQYFPSADYLRRVLTAAVNAVAPGGAVFVGDVRSLPLLPAFHASVELATVPAGLDAAELGRRAARQGEDEEELVVDPRFFFALAARLPAVRRVEVRVKRGRARNELTRFRFDAVLHIGGPAAAAALTWQDWLSLPDLTRRLTEEAPAVLALSRIPDARLAEVMALEGEAANAGTVADLRRTVAQAAARWEAGGIEPEALVETGRRAGYAVELTWAAAEEWRSGRFSAVLTRLKETAVPPPPPVRPDELTAPLEAFTNAPLAGKIARRARAHRVAELQRFLRSELPEPLVPGAFVLLDALPVTSHGKVDRGALPLPAGIERRGAAYVAPRTPVEEAVAEIWAELLDVSGGAKVSAADSFFALGGHSLLATQVVARLRERFGVELPVRAVFEEPTLAALAARVEAARRAPAGPEGTAEGGPPVPAVPLPPLERTEDEGPRPASFAQRRLWFLDRLEPGTPLYNIPAALAVHGALDLAALVRALSEIARRHEALRTVFAEEAGEPVQRVLAAAPLAVPVVDLTGLPELPEETRWEVARELAAAEAGTPFDLAHGPLWRVRLVRLAAREHQALLTLHHIVSDGWSTEVLVREVAALYTAFAAGRPSPLPELPVQYGDYAVWQRRWLAGPVLARELAYWRRQLAGAPALELPADRLRPAFASHRGALVQWAVPEPLGAGLRLLARRFGATLFSTLLAAFQALLLRLSGQEDVSVGTPVAGRSHVEIEGLIGFFVNTLVLRSEMAGDPPFRELLARARETSLAAQAHQAVPFDRLVEELAPERSLSRSPLFQVMFALQNAPRAALDLPGLTLAPLPLERPAGDTAKFDLTLTVEEGARGLAASFEYSTDLFDRATIVRWSGHLERLLAGVVESPSHRISELPLLSAAERHELTVDWNDRTTAVEVSRTTLYGLFVRQAERTPGAWALEGSGVRLTYGELRDRAERLAARLRRRGVAPEAVVAVCVERSPALVVGLLGALAAGGVYLPIDPALPALRRDLLLADSGARVLVTESGLLAAWPVPGTVEALCLDADGEEAADHPLQEAGALPGHLAYLIYTSGSSGQPKGVAVTHEEAARHCAAAVRVYGLTAEDRVLQFVSAGFDVSLEEILPTLAAGAEVVLRGPELPHPADLLAELARRRVTVANFPTAYWQQWAREGGLGTATAQAPLRLVIIGGEAMSPLAVAPWEALRREAFPAARLLNGYGPTEAIVTATLHEVVPADERGAAAVSIGRPMPHRSAYVVDRHGGLQPVGAPGELWLGGLLARGYLGDPARTAERFIPDPFGPPGGRLYRTGDLVRREPSGELSFLGRLDHQVKVRGFRVELGEIETAIAAVPGVREAVVVVWGEGEERRLAAFFVPEPGRAAGGLRDQLRDRLRERLPGPLVPAAFVPLAVLPLTPNGKVDRQALPDPFAAEGGRLGGRPGENLRPRTPVEEVVAAIWCDVLELPEVGLGTSFFDLGGHSLLATRVSSRLRAAFGVELPLRDLFEQPTVEGLAGRVEAARRRVEDSRAPAPPIVRIGQEPGGGPFPLSFAQQRLWFLDQMEPGGSAYNIPFAVRLDGPLNAGLLGTVLNEIVRRHEALRTRFDPRGGDPVQVVDPPAPLAMPLVDLEGLQGQQGLPANEAEASRLVGVIGPLPFDLARGPLLRAFLLRLSPARHVLLASIHHIVSDEWSMRLLLREMKVLYRAFGGGLPSPLPELPVQYADYAVWQRRWLAGEALAEQLAFWREKLGDEPPVLELPADRPRPAVQSYRGGVVALRLPDPLAHALLLLSRHSSATPFMTLLAAFAAFLGRTTGQTDLAIGTPITGRTRLEIEELIGFFLNTLVLRIDLAGDPSFSALLAQVRESSLAAYAHQDLPFEKLVDELRPHRSLAHSPLFQALFVLLHEAPLDEEVLGLRISSLPMEQRTAKFDLSLALAAEPGGIGGISGAIEYAADLFDRATVVRFAGHLERLLAALAEDPGLPVSRLPLSSPAEAHQVLCEWNDTRSGGLGQLPVHELFARAARRHRGAAAVVWAAGSWSFAELDARAERLALRLRAEGVGPGAPVGVLAARGPYLAAALLAVLKAGGAYLPLDPAFPRERLLFMLADSGARAVLTQGGARFDESPGLIAIDLDTFDWETTAGRSAPPAEAGPDATAYVIYTSGSTGRPKGITLPHRTLANLIAWQIERLAQAGIDPALRTVQFSSPSFDVSLHELFATWCAGAALVVGSDEERRDPRLLVQLMARQGVERIFLPYVALQQLAEHLSGAGEHDPVPSRLREVVTAGERLQITPQIAAMFRRLPGCMLRNHYGPSETHVVTEFSLAGDPGRWPLLPPIGRPLAGTTAYVIDRAWQPVALGVAGELAIGGVSLASGYIERPDLTAEKFIPDPFAVAAGGRLYRSGDLARFRPDGEIEFLGRIDDQVKIRGFRIEPGEIEVALAAHPQVREAVVVVRGDGTAAGRRLVAYVTPADRDATEAVTAELRPFLRERLPEFMIPAAFVVLPALPLTASGKVQRSALPEPEVESGPYVEPATVLERMVAEVLAEQLDGKRVGRDDNFFDAGAHSLLLVRVAAELTRRLGRAVAVVDLFRFPTVAALARHLGNEEADAAPPDRAVFAQRAAERSRRRAGREAPFGAATDVRRDEMVNEATKSPTTDPDRAPDAPEVAFEQIAVIGMACRYPGAADPGELWRNLRDGVESITRLSDEELAAEGVPAELIDDPSYVKAGGLLDGPELFDAEFFGFTPREAELMDPQHRLFLECAWQACEDAGYVPQTWPGRIGVYGGSAAGTYFIHNVLTNPEVVAAAGGMQVKLLNDKDFLTTHVSYKLNLRGPSLAIQTACSTSLVAVHIACQALLDGECDMALAGGTGISFPHRTGALYREGGINSPDGHCRAFDIRAKGLVDGNGTGVVLLKRLSRALADGDFIHAVVRGSAINNDGAQKAGYTVPSVESQMEVIGEALAAAGVDAGSIGLVEAHGSGTPLGDPIEVQALTRAFRATTDRRGYCALGSVKTNIGHTDAAAGVAGLIKAVKALENRQIPPSLHFETPNPACGLPESPFFVPTRALDWPAGGAGSSGPRRAGVSSLGIGGTNAHVVLEEAPPAPAAAPSRPWQLLMVSARTPAALDRAAARLGDHLTQGSFSRFELADVAHTLRVGRRAFQHRRAVLCRDRAGAVAGLADPARRIEGMAPVSGERPVAFLFPGLGEHYAGMAAGLYRTEPAFRAAIDRSAEILGPHLGIDLRELLVYWEGGTPSFDRAPGGPAQPDLRRLLAAEAEEDDEAGRQLGRTAFAHPAVFAVEHALAELWLAWGIRPRAMIGYSLGEYVAACLAGVFSLQDALALVAGRARLIDALPAGAMLAVPLAVAETVALLAGEPGLALAAANGPGLSVVAGPEAAAAAFARRLAERGIACRRLRTGHAFHSPMMRPITAELTRLAAGLDLRPPRIPFVSNVTGTWITAAEVTDPAYWAEHLCRPVRFASGLETLTAGGEGEGDAAHLLLEVGPGQTLGTLARQRPGRPAGEAVVASLRDRREEVSDQAFLLDALARLWAAGAAPDWAAFTGGERRRRMPLPTYPFERRRFFLAPGKAVPAARSAADPSSERRALADWFYEPYWESAPGASAPETGGAAAPLRWLILGDGAGLAARLEERLTAGGAAVRWLPRPEDLRALFREARQAGELPRRIVHLRSLDAAANEAEESGFYSLLALAQALAELDPESRAGIHVGAVTSGVAAVLGDEALVPERAALLGPCRVLPQEVPGVTSTAVDVAESDLRSPEALGRLAGRLIGELAGGGASRPEPFVALRGRRRFRRRFRPIALPPAGKGTARLRKGGIYLVTGGLDETGVVLAERLFKACGARLALVAPEDTPPMSRWGEWLSALDERSEESRRLRRILALERSGCEILVTAADLAHPGQVRQAVALALARFGVVHGVVHAAGRAGAGLMQWKTRAQAASVLAPQMHGTRNLAAALARRPLDFFVLFGANAGVTGGFGQADTAAGAAFLDAFAQREESQDGKDDENSKIQAIDWGFFRWQPVTAPTPELAASLEQGLDRYGITESEMFEVFLRVLGSPLPQVVVSTQDLDLVTGQLDAFSAADLLGEIGRGAAASHARPELPVAYETPRGAVEETVARVWQEAFGIDRVGRDDNFFDLSGNSLLAIQIVTRISQAVGVDLSTASLLEAPTVAGLAEEIERLRTGSPGSLGSPTLPEEADPAELERLLGEIESLSTEEAEAKLARELEAMGS